MQTLWQDLRPGARILVQKPGFRLIAVITLALGIVADKAVLGVAEARPLPYQQAEQRAKASPRNTAPDIVEPGKRDPELPDSNSPPALTAEDVAGFSTR